ncbi:MAG TPA: diguanylate cyclase [Kofleriaceae bacterium]
MAPPRPPDEDARLRALRSYGILDSDVEPSFDRITSLVARVLDVPIALVTLIDAERQWFKSCAGLGGSETERDLAFCSYTILRDEVLVIPDAYEDGRFAHNPYVTGEPFVRAYAGAPLRTPEGYRIGSLCAIDRKPRQFTADQLATLVDLAQIVIDEMELRRQTRERKVFERVFKLSPNVVYVMNLEHRRVVWASTSAHEKLGFTLDDLSEPALRRSMPADDAKRASDNLARAQLLADGQNHQATYRLYRPNGEDRWMLFRTTPFERNADGTLTEVLAMATDVTALVQAEARATESERALAGRVDVLEAILETAGEGILVADEHSQIIIANPLARRVIGRGPGDTLPLDAASAQANGFFEPDGETVLDPDRLPLVRALAGEPSDSVSMFVKNARFPHGVHLISTGRPVHDREGQVRGGVVTLSDTTALRVAQDRLAELAVTDELTQLPNRRALRDRLELLAAEAARGRRYSIAIADIDFFKRVNDTHGHAVGDAVLVMVAHTLREQVRRNDLVARLGGEEFCVVQTDVDAEQMLVLTERLRLAIASITEPFHITASFGVCHSSKSPDANELLEAADRALYTAKAAGRNRVAVAD